MGIVNIGYTRVNPELVNTEEPIYTNAIVLTLEMGEDIIETPPGSKAQELNDATYKKMGNITYALSDFIRSQGFATQVAHPYGSMLNFSPLGQEAGLGWIGQSGLLITPELGPRQKISAILTSIENLPVKTHNEHSWIPEYCEKCGKCIRACPEKALIERKTCCGNKEIEFIQARCIGCTQGCTYCIESCPFDEKGYAHVKDIFDRINARLKDRKNKYISAEYLGDGKMSSEKIALAACSGMSPYGLVARVTSADTVNETENTISICMGATAADREGFRNLIKKYPIIAINGCDGNCTTKILNQKGVTPAKTLNVLEELKDENFKPSDVSRLDEEGEICVEFMKKKVKNEMDDLKEENKG